MTSIGVMRAAHLAACVATAFAARGSAQITSLHRPSLAVFAGAGAALGIVAVVIVGISTFVSHVLAERDRARKDGRG